MRHEPRRRERRHHRHPHHDGPVRLRHGDVRAALLVALQDGPAHGYELGQRLENISNGAWRPSPGSIYPTLQTLADEDCVSAIEHDGKRVYTLEKKGLAEVKAREARGDDSPWLVPDGNRGALRDATHALRAAAKQIAVVGSSAQQQRAVEIVTDARRRLYELLVNE